MKHSLVAIALAATITWPAIAIAEATPRWRIACESAKKDQFGQKLRRYCSLLVFNDKGNGSLVMDDERTYILNSRTIVEVDATGLHPLRPPIGNYCTRTAQRVAVDGKRIDAMSSLDQLRTMVSGRIFVWEEQADWPYCGNKAPHGTTLEGFRDALIEMQRQFDEMSKQ
jgi:hypothetical protein